jgi:hypothetical protein
VVQSQRYNEWYAAVWKDENMKWLGTPININNNEGNFTDLFNPEFAGDLEPMKELYKDNYYWQTAGHIRLHKGVPRSELPAGPTNVKIDGSFGEWSTVKPVFFDAPNDIAIRDYRGNPDFIEETTQTLWYKNTTARNDFTETRVAYNDTTVFFNVKTKSAITASTDTQWMVLFIDTDRRKNTGWEGYDLRVNYQRTGNNCTIEKYDNGNWTGVKNGIYSTSGNELELSIPRNIIEANPAKLVFDFKWSDNALSATPTAMDFWENGDVAPQTRLNYRFSEMQDATAFGGVAYNLPGIIEAENFNNGAEGIAFHENTPDHLGWAYNFRYPNTAVDMDYIPDNKGIAIGNIENGEWLAYTVYVSTTGNYTPVILAATNDDNGAFHIEVDGVNTSGKIVLANSGNAFTKSVISDKSIPLTAGAHIIKLVFEGSFSLDAWGFSSDCNKIRSPYKSLSIPGTIEAEDFDTGCNGVSYSDAEVANLGGQYRMLDGVDIEVCGEGGYDVGWIATAEWMEYTLNVATTGDYQLSSRVSSPNDNNQFHIEFDRIDKTGLITVDKTGGFQNWISTNKTVHLSAGEHIMRFYVDKANGFNINNFKFTSAGAPTLGTGTGLTGNYYNDSYSFNLTNWSPSATETGAWNPPSGISWFSSPAASRTDANINVNKGDLEPFLSSVPNLNEQGPVSVRWTGFIEFLYAGTYTLYLSGADGLRLNINNQKIIGTSTSTDPAWVVRPYLEKNTNFFPLTGIINVTSAMVKTKMPIIVEFFSAGVTQWSKLAERGIKLEWESTVQYRGAVASTQLYPNEDCAGATNGTAKTDACGICTGGTTGKVTLDTDKDGIPDCVDPDQDNDGVLNADDCAPLDPAIKGKTIWYADLDGDGFGDPAVTQMACTKPTGYVADKTDACPTDPNKKMPGDCGCNKVEGTCLIPTSVSSADLNIETIRVYPNPITGEEFYIDVPTDLGDVDVQMYDLASALIFKKTTTSKSRISILAPKEPGVYIINVSGEKVNYFTKIIITH